MSDPRSVTLLRIADLPTSGPTEVTWEPDAEARAALARALDLIALRKLRLSVRLSPRGRSDWQLEGTLGATVVQPCVVTLAPVTTRIDEPVSRSYLADWQAPEGGTEIEMPEDDSAEPLPAVLDLAALAEEALALALPPYPRAEGAEPFAETFAGPGVRPMTDDDARPFAGLAGLRDSLAGAPDDEETPAEPPPDAPKRQ